MNSENNFVSLPAVIDHDFAPDGEAQSMTT